MVRLAAHGMSLSVTLGLSLACSSAAFEEAELDDSAGAEAVNDCTDCSEEVPDTTPDTPESMPTTDCGDGVVEAPELCDLGSANSDAPDAACRRNCRPQRCGDGIVDTGEVCDDRNTVDGDGCAADCSALLLEVEPVYPASGSNWNDYAKYDGADLFSATDSVCTGLELRSDNCIHSGEMRKIALPGVSDCTGISAEDSLGVFSWTCRENGGEVALFSRLKSSRGLADIIEGVSGFKSIHVDVTLPGSVASTTPSQWWTNPVLAVPDNSGASDSVEVLDGEGTIYVVPSTAATQGYHISASRVALVTVPGVTLAYAGSANGNCNDSADLATSLRCVVSVSDVSFPWIEGDFDASGSPSVHHGVALGDVNFARLNHLSVSGGGHGLWVTRGNALRAHHIESVDSTGTGHAGGLHFDAASYARASNLSAMRGAGAGITVRATVGARLYDIYVEDSGFGLYVDATRESAFVNVTSLANSSDGLRLWSSSNEDNAFVAVTSRQNSGHGIYNYTTVRSNFHLLASTENDMDGLHFQAQTNGFNVSSQNTLSQLLVSNTRCGLNFLRSSGNKVVANLLAGNHTQDPCCVTLNSPAYFPFPGVSDETCTLSGTDGSADYTAGDASNATLRVNRDAASSFADGASDFSADLLVTDSVALNRTGDGSSPNAAFVPDAACPPEVHGDEIAVDLSAGPNTYLLAALEIMGDRTGDDDGLCESNEACLYAPNFGAYQGHGSTERAYLDHSCIFQDDGGSTAVTGVRMYAHPSNGR